MSFHLRHFQIKTLDDARQAQRFIDDHWQSILAAGFPLQVLASTEAAPATAPQKRALMRLISWISQHAETAGQRNSSAAWLTYFKQLFLGDEISIHDLSIAEISNFITEIEFFALDELGLDVFEFFSDKKSKKR